MKRLVEMTALGGVLLLGVLVPALFLARQGVDVLAPVYLVVLVICMGLYMFPSLLAGYRNTRHMVWIATVNLLLGWTFFGWFICLGWAALGDVATTEPDGSAPSLEHRLSHR
ncbi:MAG: superinfection immunity protein [Acidobacteriota bacterium]